MKRTSTKTVIAAANVSAEGEHDNGNSKVTVRIGQYGDIKFYPSVSDAANKNNMFPQNMSRLLINGKPTRKGIIFCYATQLNSYLDIIAERSETQTELISKAAAYDAILAEQEAKAKAEEDARKAKEKAEADRQKAIEKATERLERRKEIYARKKSELDEAYQYVKEAERELETLTGTKKLSLVPYEIIPKDGGYELTINGVECDWVPNMEIANQCIDHYMSHNGKEEDK